MNQYSPSFRKRPSPIRDQLGLTFWVIAYLRKFRLYTYLHQYKKPANANALISGWGLSPLKTRQATAGNTVCVQRLNTTVLKQTLIIESHYLYKATSLFLQSKIIHVCRFSNSCQSVSSESWQSIFLSSLLFLLSCSSVSVNLSRYNFYFLDLGFQGDLAEHKIHRGATLFLYGLHVVVRVVFYKLVSHSLLLGIFNETFSNLLQDS